MVYNYYVVVTQSCLTLCDPIDCSLPGSIIPGIFQARILAWSVLPVPSPENLPNSGIFLTKGLNLGLRHYRQMLYHLSHQGIVYVCVCVCVRVHVRARARACVHAIT